MTAFSAILAVFEAIPILDKWLQAFIAWYVGTKIASMNEDNANAIKNAVAKQNQIDLEKALGNKNAGNPTNYPGTSIVNDLPGVSKPNGN